MFFFRVIVCCIVLSACNRNGGNFDAHGRQELVDAGVTLHDEGQSKYWEDYSKAIELLQTQQYDAALGVYQALLQKEEKDKLPAVYIGMASVYELKQDPITGLKYYITAWQLDTNNVSSSEALSSGYYQLGRYPEAIHYGEQVAARAPDRPDSHYVLAASYQQIGLWSFAVTHAKRYVELVPDSPRRIYMDQIIERGGG